MVLQLLSLNISYRKISGCYNLYSGINDCSIRVVRSFSVICDLQVSGPAPSSIYNISYLIF